MKKVLLMVVIGISFNLKSHSQLKKFQNMLGSWVVVGQQNSEGVLEIIDSSTIVLRYMGEEKKIMAFKIDFSKSPFWFDFSTKDTASVVDIKSIIEFVNDDMLKWQIFIDEERQNYFSSTKGELFYLKRAGPKSNSAYYSGTGN